MDAIDSLKFVKSMLIFTDLHVEDCFDLFPALSFDAFLRKLLKVKL
jgi:hypothetical protein